MQILLSSVATTYTYSSQVTAYVFFCKNALRKDYLNKPMDIIIQYHCILYRHHSLWSIFHKGHNSQAAVVDIMGLLRQICQL